MTMFSCWFQTCSNISRLCSLLVFACSEIPTLFPAGFNVFWNPNFVSWWFQACSDILTLVQPRFRSVVPSWLCSHADFRRVLILWHCPFLVSYMFWYTDCVSCWFQTYSDTGTVFLSGLRRVLIYWLLVSVVSLHADIASSLTQTCFHITDIVSYLI